MDFNGLSALLVSNIQEISQNVNSLQILVNRLGTPKDSLQLRSELHELQQRTNALSKECSENIKLLSKLRVSSDPTEQRERKLLNERMRNDFLDVLNTFQDIQRSASEKEKHNIIKESKNTKPYNPFYEETQFNGQTDSSGPIAMIQVDEEVERNNLDLIKEQHEAIKRLESDIVDVNQIFIDLGRMIHEQQDLVDNIENNVQTTIIQVEAGTTELQRAAELQFKARKKKAMIILILVLILLVVTLIIYLSVNT